MKRFYTILKTELKLSIRGMDMIIFAICMPLVAISLLGIIFGSRPAYPGAGYTFLEQSFGAVSAIAVCAGGVMGLPLVISEYRQKKILKRYQVTPASPALLLAVQTAVYTVYSLASLVLVYAAVLFFGARFPGSAAAYLAVFLFVMLAIFSIGMMIGGIAPDVRTAGMWASILYFPMLVLSGATLPYETMPSGLQRIADMMPLTQESNFLRRFPWGCRLRVYGNHVCTWQSAFWSAAGLRCVILSGSKKGPLSGRGRLFGVSD